MNTPVSYRRGMHIDRGTPCLICGAVVDRPVTDHCDEHGWVRGVLCRPCRAVMLRFDHGRIMRTEAEKLGGVERFRTHRDRCHECELSSVKRQAALDAAVALYPTRVVLRHFSAFLALAGGR